MTKFIVTAGIVAVATVFAPQSVAAQECVRGYEACLNDTHDTSGWTQTLADIECFAGYVGCVARLL